jgi:Ca2+-binding RTX toxin-like protein
MRKREIGMAGIACAALAIALAPASALGAVSCHYSNGQNLLTIDAPGAFAGITRAGDAIVVGDGSVNVSCSGSTPIVSSTDRVQVNQSASNRISLSGGPFAPAVSADPDGSPEVKFAYTSPGSMDVFGSASPDRLTLGPAAGINLNGDADVDVTGPFTRIVLEGVRGNDLIAPQAGYTRTPALVIESGGGGRDTLLSPPDGAVLHGGAGRDKLTGGRGRDNITGGRGSDLIRAGRGRDLIRARDNTRDRVNCGPGIDGVKADGIDRLRGCEHRLVKR